MANEGKMLVVKGKGNGYAPAIGEIKYYYPKKNFTHTGYTDANTELCSYEIAKRKVKSELEALIREISAKAPERECWIFSMQLLLIDDALFSKDIESLILKGYSAIGALCFVRKKFFEGLNIKKEKGFLDSVADEVEDLILAITEYLVNIEAPLSSSEYILLYPAPLPLHIARMKSELAGIVASGSDWSSDICELVGTMSIPLLVSDTEICEGASGKKAIIDAEGGYLYIDPDMSALQKFSDRLHLASEEGELRDKIAKMPTVTKSGRRISLLAELSEPSEEDHADLEGLAILKSASELPSSEKSSDEDTLFYFYRQLAEITRQKPLIIRSMRDRPCVKISKMQTQGGVASAEHSELYVIHDRTVPTQLRALLRAAVYGNILFATPTCTASPELEELSLLIEELYGELRSESREASVLSLGVIIDTLPSLILSEDLLGKSDFFVIEADTILSQLKKLSPSESVDIDEEDNKICIKSLTRLIYRLCEKASAKKKGIFLYFRNIPSEEELKIALSQSNVPIIIPSRHITDLKKMIIES